jgi:hypothetical protein
MNRIIFTSALDTCKAAVHNSYGQNEVPAWGRNETSAALGDLKFVLESSSNILCTTVTRFSAENSLLTQCYFRFLINIYVLITLYRDRYDLSCS